MMKLLKTALPSVAWWILAGIVVSAAIVLSFMPLHGVIGYDSAAVFGVLCGFGASFVSRNSHPWLTGSVSPVRIFLQNTLTHLGIASVAFLILTVNGLRILNCDYGLGVQFWVVIVAVSIAIGVVTRMMACQLGKGRLGRLGWAAAVILASVTVFGLRLALEPPIIGFQLHLGYFSGSIYDEGLALPQPLIWYRGICVLGVAGAVAFMESLWRQRSYRPVLLTSSLAALSLILCGYGAFVREGRGVDISSEHIIERLGGAVESEHFVIYYSTRGAFASDVDRMVEDHEFRYAELKEFFDTDPVVTSGKKIRSFVYAGPDEKGQLMGGRRTLVARLWLHEMHITWKGFGDHILAHEMAHIFTEPFGTGPLKLSTRAVVGINMGLVEGIATAADWPPGDFTPHEATAVLRRLNIAPDIRLLVGASGFWGQSSSRAYTVTGSFIKFLVDTYGIEKLKRAYGHGEFEQVYGKSLDSLATQWETFLDAVPLDESRMEVARYLYDRPSIFQKVCARTLADLRRQAVEEANQNRLEQAIQLYEQVVAFDPSNPLYRLEYARFLANHRRTDEAIEVVKAAREVAVGPVNLSQLEEIYGDILWEAGKRDEAATHYQTCLDLGLPQERRRAVGVKLRTAKQGDPVSTWAMQYLVSSHGEALLPTLEWLSANPTDPMINYLVARRHLQSRRYSDALVRLGLASGLTEPLLVEESNFLGAQAAYHAGQLDVAQTFVGRMQASDNMYYKTLGEEWANRLRWKRAQLAGIQ